MIFEFSAIKNLQFDIFGKIFCYKKICHFFAIFHFLGHIRTRSPAPRIRPPPRISPLPQKWQSSRGYIENFGIASGHPYQFLIILRRSAWIAYSRGPGQGCAGTSVSCIGTLRFFLKFFYLKGDRNILRSPMQLTEIPAHPNRRFPPAAKIACRLQYYQIGLFPDYSGSPLYSGDYGYSIVENTFKGYQTQSQDTGI